MAYGYETYGGGGDYSKVDFGGGGTGNSAWMQPGGVMDILKSFKSGQGAGMGIWPGVATLAGGIMTGNPIGVFSGIAQMAIGGAAEQKAKKQRNLETLMASVRR